MTIIELRLSLSSIQATDSVKDVAGQLRACFVSVPSQDVFFYFTRLALA